MEQTRSPLQGFEVATALLLVILLFLFLPQGKRRLVRGSFLLLGISLLFFAAQAIPHSTDLHIDFWIIGFFFALCSVGRSLFMLSTRSVLAERFWKETPKIILDMIQALIYLIVLLFTLKVAGFDAKFLLTGSALVTAAIGLSLRDSLGNLFAGLAVQSERPFEVGDWIQFDQHSYHIGKVLEINWRATKVLTLDEVEVIVPNSQLATYPIRNFTKPQRHSRRSIYVITPYDVPTRTVQQIILEAIADAWGVLQNPPPSVVTNAFTDRGIEYWVRIFTTEFDKRDKVDGGVRDRIWYALHRHGIPITISQHRVLLHQIDRESEALDAEEFFHERREALARVHFLDDLPEDALDHLAAKARRRLYTAGEVIIRQGDYGDDLFLVHRGEVAVVLQAQDTGDSVELARLGPPHFFGELSFMTGVRRSATVHATRDCELYIISKADLAPILEANPELAEHISATLAHRQAERDASSAKLERVPFNESQRSRDLLKRIRDFFSL